MNESTIPKILKVRIPLIPAYGNRYVHTRATTLDLQIPINEGTHTFTSEFADVGELRFFKDPILQARITIWYQYKSTENELILCGSDLISDDTLLLTTVPRGTSQYGNQHAHGADHHPCGENPNWNYCSPLMPGLREAFHDTLQAANNLILKEAEKEGFDVLVRRPPPVLMPDLYERLCRVYYKGKFLEYLKPEKEYDSDHTLVHFFSIVHGTGKLSSKQKFANVDGSTGDPYPTEPEAFSSWIEVWNYYNVPTDTCASLNFYSADGTFQCSVAGIKMLGGHCIKGLRAQPVDPGENKTAFIIPICPGHNSKKRDDGYFLPLKHKAIVWLDDFHGTGETQMMLYQK